MGRKEKDREKGGHRRQQRDYEAEAEEELNSEEYSQSGDVIYSPSQGETGIGVEITVPSSQETDKYYEALEMINEKKAASRLKGLQQLTQFLQSGGAETFPSGSLDTLTSNLTKLIRRPASPSEGVEAMRVVSVLSLIVGPNDHFVESFSSLFCDIISRVEDEDLRLQALKSLSFMSFVCSTSHSDTSAWSLCEELILLTADGLEVTATLRSNALKSWCLLSTSIHPELVLEHSRDGVFEAILETLDDADTDGKIIAAEGLAFLWEVACNHNPEGESSSWESMLSENPRECERAISLLTNIGKESSKRIAKKDKKERKSTMRMVLDWIVEGIVPEETLELRGTELEINTFSSLQQVAILRDVLGDGFQACLRSFPCTREILEVEYISESLMKDDLDAKARHAHNERQRTGYRRQDRRDKAHAYSAQMEDEW